MFDKPKTPANNTQMQAAATKSITSPTHINAVAHLVQKKTAENRREGLAAWEAVGTQTNLNASKLNPFSTQRKQLQAKVLTHTVQPFALLTQKSQNVARKRKTNKQWLKDRAKLSKKLGPAKRLTFIIINRGLSKYARIYNEVVSKMKEDIKSAAETDVLIISALLDVFLGFKLSAKIRSVVNRRARTLNQKPTVEDIDQIIKGGIAAAKAVGVFKTKKEIVKMSPGDFIEYLKDVKEDYIQKLSNSLLKGNRSWGYWRSTEEIYSISAGEMKNTIKQGIISAIRKFKTIRKIGMKTGGMSRRGGGYSYYRVTKAVWIRAGNKKRLGIAFRGGGTGYKYGWTFESWISDTWRFVKSNKLHESIETNYLENMAIRKTKEEFGDIIKLNESKVSGLKK